MGDKSHQMIDQVAHARLCTTWSEQHLLNPRQLKLVAVFQIEGIAMRYRGGVNGFSGRRIWLLNCMDCGFLR